MEGDTEVYCFDYYLEPTSLSEIDTDGLVFLGDVSLALFLLLTEDYFDFALGLLDVPRAEEEDASLDVLLDSSTILVLFVTLAGFVFMCLSCFSFGNGFLSFSVDWVFLRMMLLPVGFLCDACELDV